MKRERNILFITLGVLWLTAAGAGAGDLNPPAGPDDPLSAMYTLEDLYNRLDTGAQGAKRTGAFTGPAGPPGASGRSLESVMGKMPEPDNTNGVTPAEVPAGKTFWGLRTDGSWGPRAGTGPAAQPACTGTLSPAGRWCDQGDGTVRDMNTNLVWLKASESNIDYAEALMKAYNMQSGVTNGLSDGSTQGDWRLPSREEYRQLDTGPEPIHLPGHFFTKNLLNVSFWTGPITIMSTGTPDKNDPRVFYVEFMNNYFYSTTIPVSFTTGKYDSLFVRPAF